MVNVNGYYMVNDLESNGLSITIWLVVYLYIYIYLVNDNNHHNIWFNWDIKIARLGLYMCTLKWLFNCTYPSSYYLIVRVDIPGQ